MAARSIWNYQSEARVAERNVVIDRSTINDMMRGQDASLTAIGVDQTVTSKVEVVSIFNLFVEPKPPVASGDG